jgi:hypothetical protein
MNDVFGLIAAGRRRAADLLDQLSEEQLAVQSLCPAWTVHDMAGHLVAPFCVSMPRFALGSIFAGGFDAQVRPLPARAGRLAGHIAAGRSVIA